MQLAYKFTNDLGILSIKENFHREIDTVLGKTSLSLEKLNQLEYIEQIIQEAMRIFPVGWLVTRYSLREEILGDCKIKAKSNIFFSPYLLHRNEKYWKNPKDFIPERFSAPLTKEQQKAYIPFGGGPRICIGKHLAMMEMKVALALLGQKFDFKLKDGFQVEKLFSGTLIPKNGVWIELKPRM